MGWRVLLLPEGGPGGEPGALVLLSLGLRGGGRWAAAVQKPRGPRAQALESGKAGVLFLRSRVVFSALWRWFRGFVESLFYNVFRQICDAVDSKVHCWCVCR